MPRLSHPHGPTGHLALRRATFAVIESVLLTVCAVLPVYAQGIITTLAGKDVAFTGDGRAATGVPLGAMGGVATDSQGNVYFTDLENHLVLKTGADGVLHVVAGNGIPGYSGDGGPATSASLGGPLAIALDSAGNLYISEELSHRIRKVSPAGIISTFAGSGQPDHSGDGGPAIKAGIGQEIAALICDAAGNVYLAERFEHVVRRVDRNGNITTIAGTGQPLFGGDGGPASQASLIAPTGLAFDTGGNLLVADSGNFRIRSVTPAGIISTIAGGGFYPIDGIPASAALIVPLGVAADAAGNVYVGDYLTARVRRIDSTGTITTIAGSGLRGFSGDGGPATAASLANPWGLATDARGNILIADFGASRVRKVGTDGVISTIAGNGLFRPSPDGAAGTDTAFRFPWGITTVADGSVVFSEYLGSRVRRIGPDGIVSTLAGTGQAGTTPDGGKGTSAGISLPNGVAVDAAGNLFFSEEINFRVRKVTPAGTISTAVGNGLPGSFIPNGVPATTVSLAFPYGITLDTAGNLYMTDQGQNLVRKISPAGIITTVAGTGTAGFTGDNGPGIAATVNSPTAVAADSAGNVYFSDRGNLRVRKVNAAGVITTIAGNGRATYSGEGGPARNASLSPNGLAVDAAGNLYIADPDNQRILKISTAGTISTFAGNGQEGSAGDGGPATLASLNSPVGVAVDAKGNVYITDSGNGRVRVVLAAPASFSASPKSLSFSGRSTGAVTATQSVQIAGSTPGLPFSVALATVSGGAWLQASLKNGTMPYALQISADPGQLQPGNYQGTVTITGAGAQPPVQTIAVSLSVVASDPPALSVVTDALTFSAIQGQGAATRVLAVSNTGGGSIALTSAASTASGGNWLSVTPAQASATANAPGNITITADPSGLAPGTYLGQFSISGSTGQVVVVPTTLIVSPVKQKLLLTSSGFTFQAVAGGGVVPPQSFGIANSGDGTLNWTATPGPNWLALSPASVLLLK